MGPEVRLLTGLACALCDDLALSIPSLAPGLKHDKRYIVKRASSEGLSFLIKVLPAIGKCFDEWLKEEIGAPDFSSVPFLAPTFLSGVRDLFGSGLDLHDRAHLIRWVRQLAYLFYKLEVAYTPEQLTQSFSKFEEVDLALEKSDASIDWIDACKAGAYLGDCLAGFNARKMVPRHGPGAVATGEKGDMKWAFRRKYRSVHRVFPWYEFFVPSLSSWTSAPDEFVRWYHSLELHDYPVARVVAVPKDSRGPRLISEEPLELQYLQQGYARELVPFIEERSTASGHVNFTDQTINQRLALQGSRTGEWATIDLADASDRVSDYLVFLVLPPRLYREVRALRSWKTILPNGHVVTLNKFAPMGSSLCFPIEALVFWAISRMALAAADWRDDLVYVYGDDIIVPTGACQAVCQALERFGLKVNRSKTYDTGSFRESCGVDAWSGFIVTPGRLRQLPPSQPSDGKGISNWIAVGNHLRLSGFPLAADMIQNHVDSIVKVPWNIHGTELSHVDGLGSPDPLADPRNASFRRRFSIGYQRWEVLCPSLRSGKVATTLDSWSRLHRNLVQPPQDPDTAILRTSSKVRRRWAKAHR